MSQGIRSFRRAVVNGVGRLLLFAVDRLCLLGRVDRRRGRTEYYVSTGNDGSSHRRDTLWHWRAELAEAATSDEYCYTGNSHAKPMMRVIDSDGRFHGWVGVEASLSQTSPSTESDDLGTFGISEF